MVKPSLGYDDYDQFRLSNMPPRLQLKETRERVRGYQKRFIQALLEPGSSIENAMLLANISAPVLTYWQQQDFQFAQLLDLTCNSQQPTTTGAQFDPSYFRGVLPRAASSPEEAEHYSKLLYEKLLATDTETSPLMPEAVPHEKKARAPRGDRGKS